MSGAGWSVAFAIGGLACFGLALAELRRGSTRIAGTAFVRARNPIAYWGMLLVTVLAGVALLAKAAQSWAG